MLPNLNTYSHLQNFITSSSCSKVIKLLPSEEDWFLFSTNDVSRLQSQNLTTKSNNFAKIFEIIKEELSKIGLKMKEEIIHPRLYRKNDWMDWHSDYSHLSFSSEDELVYECILVLKNTSDSVTKFKINNKQNENEIEESVYTNATDLLIVCRHGITHCVTKVTEGERLTLKFTCVKL
jgi:hypothetical protein